MEKKRSCYTAVMTGVTSQTESPNGVVVNNPGLKGNGASTRNDVHDECDHEGVSDEDDEEDEDDYEVCRG